MTNRSYLELITLPTFIERYKYLKLNGRVSDETFGSHRHLNQVLYHSPEWKRLRSIVIERDMACDLGCEGHDIFARQNILIHHINPITIDDILNRDSKVFDLNNLICCSLATHNAIHYGDESGLPTLLTERTPNDTCPWK